MSRRFLVVFLLCSSALLAQLRNPFPKAEEAAGVVREFCRLDYVGSRLSADGWKRMKPLTTWDENPAWHTFRVVSRYDQISQEGSGLHSARIEVRYLPLGTFELGIGFTPSKDPEDVTFRMKEIDDAWHVDETDPEILRPHISRAAAVQWLEAKRKTVTDPAEKISVETALKQLQGKQTASP